MILHINNVSTSTTLRNNTLFVIFDERKKLSKKEIRKAIIKKNCTKKHLEKLKKLKKSLSKTKLYSDLQKSQVKREIELCRFSKFLKNKGKIRKLLVEIPKF